MEPVTHALTSLALSRAGFNKTTRLAAPMLLVSGLAADLDWLSLAAGPRAYLHSHRTATHSLLGAAVIAIAVAVVFRLAGRKHPSAPVRLARALVVCAVGAGVHLLLDLTNAYGVKLLWPFRENWYAWDIADVIDPWILVLLLLGLLLPGLFRLVSEEIGARPKQRSAQRGAVLSLVLVVLFFCGRWALHDRALGMLRARLFHGQTPLLVGAFPEATSPLAWFGVVETDNALQEIELSLAPGNLFDPDLARTYFKPEPSLALDAARKSDVAQELLKFARFPRATVEKTTDGYRVELRDLRFSSPLPGRRGMEAVVEVNPQFQVIREELRFAAGRKP